MFCYQCEQTDRTPQPGRPNLLAFGCAATKGIAERTPPQPHCRTCWSRSTWASASMRKTS